MRALGGWVWVSAHTHVCCVPVRIIGVCVILLYSHCWHIFSGKCIHCVWNKHTRLANCTISHNATFDAPFILHHGNYIQITSQNRNLETDWAEKGREKENESKECVREWGVQSEVTSVSSYNHLLYFTLNSQPLTFYIQCMVSLFITIYCLPEILTIHIFGDFASKQER